MKGAIIGDIVGSVYEFNNIKTKDFPLFREDCFFTDDTVMTVAVADALLTARSGLTRDAIVGARMQEQMLRYGRRFPHRGYGGAFRNWLSARYPKPYYSQGNGSAMRVSAAAYAAKSLKDCERLARLSAEITHNHPDGICGAQVTAGAVYLAKRHLVKKELKGYVAMYYPEVYTMTLDEIRPGYTFDHYASVCKGTVPQAFIAFYESRSFEDAIRNAISLGGDSDTLAAITGAIAEAYYGVPDALWNQARSHLDPSLEETVNTFYATFIDGHDYPELTWQTAWEEIKA